MQLSNESFPRSEGSTAEPESKSLTSASDTSVPIQSSKKRIALAKRLWQWSGIGEKTLLELLQIITAIMASVAIPIVLNMISYQQEKAKDDNQRHEILSNYLDQMTELLLDKDNKLDNPSLKVEAQKLARARTLNTLRQLDGERKGQLLKFLYEAGLIGEYCQVDRKTLKPLSCQTSEMQIDLEGARLNGTVFDPPVPLQGIDLTGALLLKAKLQGIYLAKANMQNAALTGADLSNAILADAQMDNANLAEANLVGAILPRAVLSGANLQSVKLEKADLSSADLQGADLRDADLTGVSFQGANFKDALYNDKTNFPDGLNPASEGMRLQ